MAAYKNFLIFPGISRDSEMNSFVLTRFFRIFFIYSYKVNWQEAFAKRDVF